MSAKLYTAGVLGICLVHVLVAQELARVAHLAPAGPSTAAPDVRELAHGR